MSIYEIQNKVEIRPSGRVVQISVVFYMCIIRDKAGDIPLGTQVNKSSIYCELFYFRVS